MNEVMDRRPLIIVTLDALLDGHLAELPGAHQISLGLPTLQAPIAVVGDVSNLTSRVLAGASADREVALAVDALARAAEDFKLRFVPWFLSICPGNYGRLPRVEDTTVLNLRDLWQIGIGTRDAWLAVEVTASPVFGADLGTLTAYAHERHCFKANADPRASIVVSEDVRWLCAGYQWVGAAGLREGLGNSRWNVLSRLAQHSEKP